MAWCRDWLDESYRFIAGVLKQFLKNANPDTDSSVRLVMYTQRETSTEVYEVEAPCSTTSYYCLPFLWNRRFTGRTKKLKELEEKLMVRSDCQKLAIISLGGVGKT
ncbi:hypothetical protein MMC21_005558 [Puttea exsequens]|nr:hypothetical protein [Puttea exsequens]